MGFFLVKLTCLKYKTSYGKDFRIVRHPSGV